MVGLGPGSGLLPIEPIMDHAGIAVFAPLGKHAPKESRDGGEIGHEPHPHLDGVSAVLGPDVVSKGPHRDPGLPVSKRRHQQRPSIPAHDASQRFHCQCGLIAPMTTATLALSSKT